MKLSHRTDQAIDSLAEIMGRIGWLLVLYCMTFGVTDVFLRYVLNAPSLWIGTTLQAAMVLMACVGGAYALKYDAFVKLDLFYAVQSARTRAILDLVTAPFTFLFLVVLIWKGTSAAMLSLQFNEVTPTAVPIPIYPIKMIIPLSAVIVLLMVVRQLARDIHTIIHGSDEPE